MEPLTVIWAHQPLTVNGPSIFLAGPTRRADDDAPSWRDEAVTLIKGMRLSVATVLTPESFQGVRAEHYDDQFRWEMAARQMATVILYWIPRDVATLPGFTTNAEFGFDVASNRRVVLGAPPECPNPERNRYLVALANRHRVPVRETLMGAVATAINFAEWGFLPQPARAETAKG